MDKEKMKTKHIDELPKLHSSDLPATYKNYTYLKLIGKGGFANVYLAKDNRYSTEVVAKVIRNGGELKKEMPEVQILMRLNHPNIIRIYDHFIVNNDYHIILEYCPRGSISDEINSTKKKGYNIQKFSYLANQIVRALQESHRLNVAHRDIKPSNILIDEYNRAKLADFGLSTLIPKGEMEKSFCSSSIYTAPEIYSKIAYDPFAADIWSLGVTFAIMIQGYSPWKCDNHGVLKKLIASGKFVLSPRVPEVISDIIHRMIVVDPGQRITIDELAELPIFQDVNVQKRQFSANSSFCAQKGIYSKRSSGDFPLQIISPLRKKFKYHTTNLSLLRKRPIVTTFYESDDE